MTRGRRVLSTEGLFSLEPDARWRCEQTSEDGSFVFHDPQGHGLVRFAETLQADAPDVASGEACTVNGLPACRELTVRDGRRLRRWVVQDGRTRVEVSHEVPAEVGSDDDATVDALLATLELHRGPHPTVSALLRLLGPGWTWQAHEPLAVACPALGVELGVERLVRSIDAAPERRDERLHDEARRIRNLTLVLDREPTFDEVADSLLPLVRTGVLRETVDGRLRSVRPEASVEPRLLCGGDAARRLFAPGLFVYYAIDVPGAFHFVTPAMCASWGIGVERLEAAALQNLRRRVAGDRVDAIGRDAQRLVVVEDGEGLAASRLLLAGFRQSLERLLGGPWCVALPSAGVLIAFSRGLEGWLEVLGEDVWDAWIHEPVPLTEQVYAFDGAETFLPMS